MKKKLYIKIASIVLVFFGMISLAGFARADDTTATTTDITTSTSTDDGGTITATSTSTDDDDDATATTTAITATTTDIIATSTDVVSPTETIMIRDGNNIIFNGAVPLPSAGMISINDKNGTAHSINSRSVLSVLNSISQSSGAFSISDLEYYDSYGSFYLKCLIPQGGSEECNNWQYVVGNTTPNMGIDQTILSGGETIGLYFGSPHQVILNTTSISAGGSFIATAQQYNYLDNTWTPLTGVTIGVTVPNPNDQYNPTVVTSQAVDTSGNATLTLATAGTYTVGIADDYYFPSYTVTVSAPVQSGVGGGLPANENIPPPPAVFSIPKAVAYLTNVQSSDGSFCESDLYTDWAAIALGAVNNGSETAVETNLLNYMASQDNTVSSLLTDNERHAMALLALGQNPYSFHGVDYITPIIHSFDGTQFGDPSLDTDDIFALIPLSASGYSASDNIVAKDIQFIVSKQNSDGSWDESVDITAAGIQALSSFNSVFGVNSALAKAGMYLKNAQSADGGWENVSSSSWAIQAMNALGVSWTKNAKSVSDYLAAQQVSDGGVLPNSETVQNRMWATSYAIPAGMGKTWSEIMHAVSKPEIVAAPIVATSTQSVLTSNENLIHKNISIGGQENLQKLSFKNTGNIIQNSVATSAVVSASEISANVLQSEPATSEKIPIVIGSIGGVALLGFFARKFFGLM